MIPVMIGAAGSVIAAPPAQAIDFIQVNSISVPSVFFGTSYVAVNAINGSGLSALSSSATHSRNLGTYYSSASGTTTGVITLAFNSVKSLDKLYLWHSTESYTGFQNDSILSFSLAFRDSSNQTIASTSTFTTISPLPFAGQPMPVQVFNFPAVTGVLSVLLNFTNRGGVYTTLGEVAFGGFA